MSQHFEKPNGAQKPGEDLHDERARSEGRRDSADAVGPAGARPTKRSGRDKAIIAVLAIVLVVLIAGVIWGVRYLVTTVTAEQRDARQMAERPLPATPEELAASSRDNADGSLANEDAVAANSGSSDAPTADPALGGGEDQAVMDADGGTAAAAQVGDDPTEYSGDDPVAAGTVDPSSEDAPEPQLADEAVAQQTGEGASAPDEAQQAAGDEGAEPASANDVATGQDTDLATQPIDPNAAPADDAAPSDAAEPVAQAGAAPAQADSQTPAATPVDSQLMDDSRSAAVAAAGELAASSSREGAAGVAIAASSRRDASSSSAADANLPDSPIDFAALQADNPDIFAWLYIPNTGINLPVLQNPFDDAYYLTHDPDRNEDVYGSVFAQIANARDLTDPVTVLYGHDGEGQLKNLHYFEDEEFFAQNQELYVYIPGHVLTYRIVAAYKYDNRHILNSFDFADPAVLQQYYDSVLNPDSLLLNVREGATLDAAKDRIIQLSTCMLDEFHGSSRYIVTGVLVDDQRTK